MKFHLNRYTYALLLIALIAYLLKSYWLPTKIVGVYVSQDEETRGFAVVVLKNPPFTEKGAIKFLKNNQEQLATQYNIPLFNEFTKTDKETLYRVIFVKDKFERAKYEISLNYFRGDQELCFNGQLNNLCISVDNYLFVIDAEDGFTEEYVFPSGSRIIKLGSGYMYFRILQM